MIAKNIFLMWAINMRKTSQRCFPDRSECLAQMWPTSAVFFGLE